MMRIKYVSQAGDIRLAIIMQLCLAFFIGLPARLRQLVAAGGGLEAAADTADALLDFVDGHALHQRGDRLKVAVAAAGKLYVVDDVALQIQLDLRGAGSLCLIYVAHRNLLSEKFFAASKY